MTKKIIEYRDFSGGEYGRDEGWSAPKNSWTGQNMLVYRTGELGVRAGIQQLFPTSLATSTNSMWNVGGAPAVSNEVWFGQDDRVRKFAFGASGAGAVSTLTTALTGGSPDVSTGKFGEDSLNTYLATSKGIYSHNQTAVTALSTTVTGNTIARYGDRLCINNAANSNQLRFSAAADFTSWPAANVIVVGDDSPITALFSQRNHLVILKKGSVWILTGVPGVNETLRPVSRHLGPTEHKQVGKTIDDRLFYVPFDLFPASFDGSSVREYPRLLTPAGNPAITSFRRGNPDGVFLYDPTSLTTQFGKQGLLFANGTWTRHDFGLDYVNTGYYVTDTAHLYYQDPVTPTDLRFTGSVVIAQDNGAAGYPTFYAWSPFLDRPGSEDSAGVGTTVAPERAGDISTAQVAGEVTFPEWHSDDASEVTVRYVIVDFRSWDTGGSLTNHFDLTVDSLRRYDATGAVTAATAEWDEAGALSSGAGTLQRKVFSFGDQGPGNGMQLSLAACRGVAFTRIQVIADTAPFRGA